MVTLKFTQCFLFNYNLHNILAVAEMFKHFENVLILTDLYHADAWLVLHLSTRYKYLHLVDRQLVILLHFVLSPICYCYVSNVLLLYQ